MSKKLVPFRQSPAKQSSGPVNQNLPNGQNVPPAGVVQHVQQISQLYSGPLPSPQDMEAFKQLGVLDDIMTDFRETSKAMNLERTARANEIQNHSECEKRLTISRCRNESISNWKHLGAVFIVLGFMIYLGIQGIELLKAGNTIAGSLILGGGFFGVLTVIVKSRR